MRNNIVIAGGIVIDIFNEPVVKALGPNEGITTKIHTSLGGNAFNIAKDLVQLDYPKEAIICCGAIGDDAFGTIFQSELQHLGIKSGLFVDKKVPTSKLIMLKVENEEPRYYFDAGANASFPPEGIISKIVENEPALFYTGETGNLATIMPHFSRVMSTAKSAGCITIVDTVIPADENWSFINQAMAYIDILKCNEYEALSLTGTSDVFIAMNQLSGTGIPLIIITLACKGCICYYKGMLYEIPPFAVSCVDTAGAGDAFVAGLIKTLHGFKGMTLGERIDNDDSNLLTAMIYASACGAAAVTANGCHAGVQERAIIRMISDQGKSIIANLRVSHIGQS